MVLHPGSVTETQVASRPAMQKPAFRRRRSKGTIAGFAFGKTDPASTTTSETLNGGEIAEPVAGAQGNSTVPGSPNQSQHKAECNPIPAKPCHNARLALMCVHNAIKLGARTHLYLAPPGRARRDLQSYLRQRARLKVTTTPGKLGVAPEIGGYYGLDKMIGSNSVEEYENQEEEFLISTNTFDVDKEEQASSGDEDDVGEVDDLFSEEPMPLVEDKYANLREPLYTPVGGESSLSNPNGAPMSSGGSSVPGKLPFNRRKIRFFDLITAEEKRIARNYLENELRRSKTRAALTLSKHLRRVQREEIRRKREAEGSSVDDLSDWDKETPEEKSLLAGVSQIKVEMNPAIAAALLVESLSIGVVESIEGMAKCYDGIVNAGVALLEAQSVDPTKPPSSDDKVRATRSEVMAALAPLLVTSLEEPSGEVILLLAKLRRMCGTKRYQRRFVQRVAPSLIRPPRGAMWCLRHQNDMEAILAACELIFDSAFDIFSKGWYERGRWMLLDSKRAETLDTAAQQLRNLSSEPADVLMRGLSTGTRRRLVGTAKKMKQDGKTSEPLAEWEVIAVDREIRLAISHVLTNDWSKAALHQETRGARRTGAVTRRANAVLPSSSSSDMSPKAIPSSPGRSGAGLPMRAPHSPPNSTLHATPPAPTPETMENVFGPAFASQNLATADRPQSPPPSVPGSPPLPQRKAGRDYMDVNNESSSEQGMLDRTTNVPPPLSPRSPPKHENDFTSESNGQRLTGSPKHTITRPRDPSVGAATLDSKRPASPSSTTPPSGEMASYMPSGGSSVLSASSSSSHIPTTQYRTLTSTAAERKRTVAACRALRAQIQRFEDAFVQLHGRPPKGAAERAPLATTYAQYREWKRAIRADAACRIQALLRGARTRLHLMRSGDSDVTRVVMRRAGRPGSTPDLTIPVEIGDTDLSRGGISGTSSSDSGFGRSSSSSLSPQWTSRQVRNRINGDDRSASDSTSSQSEIVSVANLAPPVIPAEFAGLSLKELQARKRDLKSQLKQYDMNFFRRHGRMPVKAEKEPIRHLYESYNSLKSQITYMEKGGTLISSPITTGSGQQTVSPPSGSESNDESPGRDNLLAARAKKKVPRDAPPVSASMSSATASSQDLASLKAEKQELHQMLRSYEKDFFKKHKRQVSSFADIKPVAAQYRRYKEIKKQIAFLQKER
ncbi:hypothetical protein ACA910_018215 [Epithemia clementina (nom. ined.)]